MRSHRASRRVSTVLVAATLLISLPAAAADPDPWFGRDKALHFGLSAGIAAVGYTAAAAFSDSPTRRALAGGGLALAAGIGKELFDLSGHGDASWRDLTWDVIGSTTGVGLSLFVDWLIRTN